MLPDDRGGRPPKQRTNDELDPPSLLMGDILDRELEKWEWVQHGRRYSENNITDVIRLTVISLREAHELAIQQTVAAALMGDPRGGGVPWSHPARVALGSTAAYAPPLSRSNSPDMVLTTQAVGASEAGVGLAAQGGAPAFTAQLVLEHKPSGTPAQFSRASLLWPSGKLFSGDPFAEQYRDRRHIAEWVFGVEKHDVIDPRCVDEHGTHPTDPMLCEFGVLRTSPPEAVVDARRLHDYRYGLSRMYVSVPQIDAYRCSRGWVDRHADRQPDTSFTLEDPKNVAWVVLSGNAPGWNIVDAWQGWAFTAREWSLTTYEWLAPRIETAYRNAWINVGRPPSESLPEHAEWLRMLASMLRDTRRRMPRTADADG